MIVDDEMNRKLSHLWERSPVVDLQASDKMVIVSDLHMGDGGFNDDFKRTSGIFQSVFDRFYLDRGFKLLLNGDVEELLKFRFKKIMDRWSGIYSLFDEFQEGSGLFKLFGNHDWEFFFNSAHDKIEKQYQALRMRLLGGEMFFLHGHQASHWLERLHNANRLILRNLVNPLQIKNFALTLDNKPLTKKEIRMSDFSHSKGILSFMGHTHRPLFGRNDSVPGLFNSGAAIGKRGITTLEIEGGFIRLVHWWGRDLVKRYLQKDWFDPISLKGTEFYRVVLDKISIRNAYRSVGAY